MSYDKFKNYEKGNSRKPTKENPFTNIVFSDYLDAKNLALPCNTDQEDIYKDMQNLYNSTIYRNLEDVWGKRNSKEYFILHQYKQYQMIKLILQIGYIKQVQHVMRNTEYCTYYQSPNMTSQRY